MSDQNLTTETHLAQLLALKSNNERALKDLYVANYKKVERFVKDNSGSEEDARDIYQEAFIAMWRNIQLNKFNPVTENSIEAYLFQIAKYKWLDHLRSSAVKKTTTLSDHYENMMTFEELNDNDVQLLTVIKEKFKQLGSSCRDLLTRFYYRKQSLKKIAAALDWTEATAKNNKYRCMERLRALIKK